MTRIADMTQAQYEALTGREREAVDRLLADQDAGRVHVASSMNDLTPAELADEYGLPRREFKTYITKSKAGHYTVTIKTLNQWNCWSTVFKRNYIDNLVYARHIADEYLAGVAS